MVMGRKRDGRFDLCFFGLFRDGLSSGEETEKRVEEPDK